MRASDGNFYVVKHQNNPQHVRVLANEMFASRLGQWLGLPIPRVEVIEVSDWLISNTQEMRIEVGGKTVPCSSGRQLASLHPDLEVQVFDYLPEAMTSRVANMKDFPRALILDKWTGNADGRQAVFIREPRGRRYRTSFIDQGYCFNAGEWNFPDLVLHGIYYRNYAYTGVTGWESFEPALTRAEEADPIDLWRCAEPIPPEWYEYDYDGLNRMVESLYQRRRVIRDLINAFRNSSRNPFPNWKESSVDRSHAAAAATPFHCNPPLPVAALKGRSL
jgi:hypothetical protein